MERFHYYMVRISQHPGEDAGPLTGMVERLATGEKRSFASGEELLRSVSSWPDAADNIPVAQVKGQQREHRE